MIRGIWERRLGTREAAERFFAASLDEVPDPTVLHRLAAAADRIEAALRREEPIAVFGHDDPDGVTSCAVMMETLELLGARPMSYIPDRNTEGHGLYPDLVRRFAGAGIGLLLTTDGCSANVAETELAASLGMDVWVTDHHVIAEGRPAVRNLVNALASEDTAERYGDLTGAGVAALLAKELLTRAGREEHFPRLLDLVALGTVADHGDVGRNNRAMAVRGLEACARGERPAVAAATGLIGIEDPFPEKTARRLAAVFAAIPSVEGRSRGVDALLRRPAWREDVAALGEALAGTEAMLFHAVQRGKRAARDAGILEGAPAVLLLPDLAGRALGAVAASLVEETARPAAALVERDGRLLAELRAPDGIHLVEDVLSDMRGLLESWGGHRRAAGFSAEPGHTDEIRARLAEALDVPPDPAAGEPEPEADLPAGEIDDDLLRDLAAARPFGKGNREPWIRVDGEPVGAESLLRRFGPARRLAAGGVR